jgi:hypothetical protein
MTAARNSVTGRPIRGGRRRWRGASAGARRGRCAHRRGPPDRRCAGRPPAVRVPERARGRHVACVEVVSGAHAVDEVVGDLDARQRRVERGWLEHVAPHDLDGRAPGAPLQPPGVAGQAAHVVPAREQPRHEPPADVAGGARSRAGDRPRRATRCLRGGLHERTGPPAQGSNTAPAGGCRTLRRRAAEDGCAGHEGSDPKARVLDNDRRTSALAVSASRCSPVGIAGSFCPESRPLGHDVHA